MYHAMQTPATLVQIDYYVRKSFSYSLLFIFVINFHIANIVNFFKKVKGLGENFSKKIKLIPQPLFRDANIVKFPYFIFNARINNTSEKAGVLDYRSSEMSCARFRITVSISDYKVLIFRIVSKFYPSIFLYK